MEYSSHGSVSNYLASDSELSEDAIRDTLACILLALNDLHKHSFVHGVCEERRVVIHRR